VEYRHSADGMYFKAGCYTLSNTTYDQAGQFGEVVIYKLGSLTPESTRRHGRFVPSGTVGFRAKRSGVRIPKGES